MASASRLGTAALWVARAPSACRLADLRSQTWTRRRRTTTTTTQVRLRSTDDAPLPPLIYPEQPRSVKHSDLQSFLRHAERTGLDTGSTTYVGTHYEYTVSDHLEAFGFSLRRVGGASDLGIDLLGTWTLPIPAAEDGHRRMPLRVLLQCKAGAGQRIGPSMVRELEGAFVGAPVGWRSRVGEGDSTEVTLAVEKHGDDGEHYSEGRPAVIGLLVAEKPATKGIRDALARSRWPMAYICCSSQGHMKQMLWNQSAEKNCGLAGLGVTLRHSADSSSEGSTGHIVLAWQGKPLPPVASSK